MDEQGFRRSTSRRDPELLSGRGRLRLLLDTHALIWAAEDRLVGRARTMIKERAEAVVVSAVTIWGIEIKRALARLRVPEDVAGLVGEAGFERLAITFEHAREAGRLPLLHADPFDRMLVVQARLEGMTMAAGDESIRRYDGAVLKVTRS